MLTLFSFEENFVKKINCYTNSFSKSEDDMKKGRFIVTRP